MKKKYIFLMFFVYLFTFFSFCNSVFAIDDTTYYFNVTEDLIDSNGNFNVDSLMYWLCDSMHDNGLYQCQFHFKSGYTKKGVAIGKDGWTNGTDTGLIVDMFSTEDYKHIDRFSIAGASDIATIKELLLSSGGYDVCGKERNKNCYDWIANYYCGDGENSFTNLTDNICKGLYDIREDAIESSSEIKCPVPIITVGKDADGNNIGGNTFSVNFIYNKSSGDLIYDYGGGDVQFSGHTLTKDKNKIHFYSKGGSWDSLKKQLIEKFKRDDFKCNDDFGAFCGGSESGYDESHWYFVSKSSECTENLEDYNGTSQVAGGGSNFITYAGDIDFSANFVFVKNDFVFCDKNGVFLGSKDLTDKIKMVVNVFKIVVPIILLVLGSLDFVRAIFAQDEQGIKKAQEKFIKRLIVAVVIFLIPSVLKVILTVASGIWDVVSPDLCGLI